MARKTAQISAQLYPRHLEVMKQLISEQKETSVTEMIRQAVRLWLETNYKEML